MSANKRMIMMAAIMKEVYDVMTYGVMDKRICAQTLYNNFSSLETTK